MGEAVDDERRIETQELSASPPPPPRARVEDAGAPAAEPSESSCARLRSAGSSMFFTWAPAGEVTVGPSSNIAMVLPGDISVRMRA